MTDDLDNLDLEADWRLLRPKRGRALVLDEKRFGRLVVIERVGSDKHGATLWRCACDCGKEKMVSRPHLVSGRVKSCGCLQTEYRKKPNKAGLQKGRDGARQIGVNVNPDDLSPVDWRVQRPGITREADLNSVEARRRFDDAEERRLRASVGDQLSAVGRRFDT